MPRNAASSNRQARLPPRLCASRTACRCHYRTDGDCRAESRRHAGTGCGLFRVDRPGRRRPARRDRFPDHGDGGAQLCGRRRLLQDRDPANRPLLHRAAGRTADRGRRRRDRAGDHRRAAAVRQARGRARDCDLHVVFAGCRVGPGLGRRLRVLRCRLSRRDAGARASAAMDCGKLFAGVGAVLPDLAARRLPAAARSRLAWCK